jgi:hypothetical protein
LQNEKKLIPNKKKESEKWVLWYQWL